MIIPQTRREAIDLYNKRVKSKKEKTKYDMFLGGLICCGDKEFKEHTHYCFLRCNICKYYNNRRCASPHESCDEAADKTLSMPWNGGAIG